ncbi:Adenine deaminase [Rubrobacter radiotolerans]|uniref:adenine deaminase n=1 Tax=Rubrobacter radiotolerans TaxID=42256 RepID=A0A023X4L2_RUBRA|nr:adenine deaminase C-terminal domain-containing protein [Rubrobacter radiotolerans]AHY46940.1 Adenine deaminase [Rubrobacter radiotolerans]MDX5894345.1 adenine deaminase C-terminal domain-containing protein [Rubrobacter radiotolerans]SMC05792.1 Adenine deaminase [Rubrobacter radiotolerans DSM 5868]
MKPLGIGSEEHLRLLAVARGERPPDLLVRGGTLANVYSGELLPANVAVSDGHVAYVGPREPEPGPETEVVEARGLYVAPGYVEAHNHPWAMYNPVTLAAKVLPLGATTIVADTLFFHLQMGPDGLEAMLDDLRDGPLNYLWVTRLISQSRFSGEREVFSTQTARRLLDRDDVAGTAEVTRWTELAAGDAHVLAGIAAARERGKVSDGHTGGASENRLPALVAAGIDADHEAITKEELLTRLRLGLWTMLRHSSLRPDVPELARAITEDGVCDARLILTTDGASPDHLAENGFMDHALRVAVECGVPPMTALRMATVNPATWLGLDRYLGGLAPGRRADLVLLPDLARFVPELVVSGGRTVARSGELLADLPTLDWDRYGARTEFSPDLPLKDPKLYVPQLPGRETRVGMSFRSAAITAAKRFHLPPDGSLSDLPGVLHAALVDRGGRWISRCPVEGFATDLDGFASTYNTTTHLLVLGRDPRSMSVAAARVRDKRGGVALAEAGRVVFDFGLDLAGMMSEAPFDAIAHANARLAAELGKRGYPFHDVLYTLLFFTNDFLPAVKLTPRGLLDVKTGRIITPAETLPEPA